MTVTLAAPDKLSALKPDAVTRDGYQILRAMPFPVMVVSADGMIEYVNGAVEHFFGQGSTALSGMKLDRLLTGDSPLFSLMSQVRNTGASIAEYDVTLHLPRREPVRLTVQAAPCGDGDGSVVLSFQEQTFANNIDRRLVHRDAARSVTALAAVLAHEVKNPLSGIRGAAQLLEQTALDGDRQLTHLIRDEVDRICTLVDSIGVFSDQPVLTREAVNIHEVLERVRQIVAAGFSQHIRFVEIYDPSLPPVYGVRDQLIQVFLNLVKNAAEAVPDDGGEIVLTTAYRHGVRLAAPGGERRILLPLRVSIEDNGPGIPDDIAGSIFDPFVTTKSSGTGLGLALVAKLVGDLGGAVELDEDAGRTIFHVMLPMVDAAAERELAGREPNR
jgi:two-component system, NtrC family, nitrogen regulation sensor histidine kinase GlnL